MPSLPESIDFLPCEAPECDRLVSANWAELNRRAFGGVYCREHAAAAKLARQKPLPAPFTKRVYVAVPHDPTDVSAYAETAQAYARALWARGYIPFIQDMLWSFTPNGEERHTLTASLLACCDALLVVKRSRDVDTVIAHAVAVGVRTSYTLDDFPSLFGEKA